MFLVASWYSVLLLLLLLLLLLQLLLLLVVVVVVVDYNSKITAAIGLGSQVNIVQLITVFSDANWFQSVLGHNSEQSKAHYNSRPAVWQL